MQDIIIDLHCHAVMKSYSHGFPDSTTTGNNARDFRKKNSAWWSDFPTDTDKAQSRGSLGISKFTQASLDMCTQGKVGVIFNALYPFEQRFVNTAIGSGGAVQDILENITGLSTTRVEFTRDLKNYFKDLQGEYTYLKQANNKTVNVDGVQKKYRLVTSFADLKSFLETNDGIEKVAIINTIEGMHSLGTGIRPYNATTNARKTEILNNLDSIKSWEHPPFFVTFAHHFTNELCGHAKSISGFPALLTPQKRGMYNDFNQFGLEIVDKLLDNTNGKPRILIDVKHMSLKSRISYYRKIKDKSIPVIVSHGGCSGRSNQDQPSIISGASHKFLSVNINFHDFELVQIARSKGIFGIQFDERRIGRKPYVRKHIKNKTGNDLLIGASFLIWNQIQHIAQVLDNNNLNAWDIQSVGSDFDGIVNSIDGIYTYLDFHVLEPLIKKHAQDFLDNAAGQDMRNKNKISAAEIASRFLRGNALGFLERWF